MAPVYHPGPVASRPPAPPHGHSQRTLTIPAPKAHKARTPRKHRGRGGQPIAPGSTLTRRQFRKLVKATVNAQFAPQEAEQARQESEARQQGVDMQGFYDQYLAELAKHQANTQANAAASNAAFGQLAGSLKSQAPALNADSANASLVRQALTAGFGSQLAGQGANASQYADTLAHVVAPGQKLQQAALSQHQLQDFARRREELAAQKGAVKATTRRQLLSDERTYGLQRAAAALAGVREANDLTDARARRRETRRHNRRSERQTDRRLDTAQQNADTNSYRAHHPAKGKGGKPTSGPGSLTTAQESRLVQQVKNAKAAARQALTAKPKNPGDPPLTSTQVRALLAAGQVDGRKYDSDVINAAFDLLPTDLGGRGALSHPNVVALRRMGIHARRYFPVIGRPKKKIGGMTEKQTGNYKGTFGLK